MDVDLLRPGTVPISPNTILWFEFLLDKELLVKHLQKSSPDPSPTELITKFTTAVYDSMKNEIKRENVENVDLTNESRDQKLSLKVVALKILSLKVAAYIHWNLDILRTLPFKVQISLLQDLLYFTNRNTYVELPHLPEHGGDTTEPHMFALIVYHRWLLGTCMYRILNNMQNRLNGEFTMAEENLFCTPENISKSISFLTEVVRFDKAPSMLSHGCFIILSEHSTDSQFDWNELSSISKDELCAQIYYDLAIFHFYRENYPVATEHFTKCVQHYSRISNPVGFCCVDADALDSYISACTNQGRDTGTLLQQLNCSIVSHYMGILNILIKDNKVREIPLTHRINLELDIQGALSSGKFTVARDLLPKIQALNAVRCIVSQNTSHQYNYKNVKALEYLIWATAALWKSTSPTDRSLLCSYFMQLIINLQSDEILEEILNHNILSDMFDDVNIERLKISIKKDVDIPNLLHSSCWDFPDAKQNPKLEIRLLEQQIISCYNPLELRNLLVKLTIKNPSRPIWKINPQWELPIPLQSVVTSISRGFLQDFSYVMLAKSKELMLSKDWDSSIDFLKILEMEVESNGSHLKLTKLISWEILLVQITQLFEQWPANHIDRQVLAQACENCLKNNETVIPRTEVMEQCVLCLLNIGHWDFLSMIEKRLSSFELAGAISQACQDVMKYKGGKKFSKEMWETFISVFISTSQIKRSGSGNTNIIHRDSPISSSKIELKSFLNKIRDPTALSIVISMIAKLFNIVRDDGNFEVSVDYIFLWPSTLNNINSYNISFVTEALSELVLQAIRYYPTNISWLRLMGDIKYCNLNYESGLKYYLQTLIVSSDYFNVTIRPDDHLFRRMIKCCTQLGCHTQAAVLCQFLDEPDYTLAFRSLVDFKSCNDSVEAYYHCFWDINILEYLVHLHNKKGEFQRRKKAIQTIGLLELNSNNNEEIQREAVNLRKRTFLQAMCKQYNR